MMRTCVQRLASLKLTVALFALSMFLIFAGTLAQVEYGIWDVVSGYFRAFFVWIEFQLFVPASVATIPGGFPFPGGYILGGLMLANLLAAHALRFQLSARGNDLTIGLLGTAVGLGVLIATPRLADAESWTVIFQKVFGMEIFGNFWPMLLLVTIGVLVLIPPSYLLYRKRAGIVLIHAGIVVLLVGELVTAVGAHESQMLIDEDGYANYTYDLREVELAIVDPSDPDRNLVVAVPQWMLEQAADKGRVIHDQRLPFDLKVHRWMGNAALIDLRTPMPAMEPQRSHHQAATRVRDEMKAEEIGTFAAMLEVSRVTGVEGASVDMPGLYVEVLRGGDSLGTWMLHPLIDQNLRRGQRVAVNGKTYEVALRFRREYKPYRVYLLEFRHDRFVGTDKPRNFSSLVRVIDPTTGEDRQVLIKMNSPMRYDNHTFYQASFLEGDTGTVLQVVRNPGWTMPYIACLLVTAGMISHFGGTATRFLKRVKR